MARAIALSSKPRTSRFLGICAVLLLTGCVGTSAFDDLNSAQPVGSAFSVALFKNYAYLARSFGTQDAPSGQAFDADGAISITGSDNTIAGLANQYAQKALSVAKGDDVLPEAYDESDSDAENVRLELLRDLDEGRDKAPDDAARAQADYDCWILDRRVPELTRAAQSCRRSVTHSLTRLERDIAPSAPAPSTASAPEAAPTAPTPAPAAAPAAQTAQSAQFILLFDYRSATLTSEQISTISQAIDAARTGRQSHITVVGHTDTAENSQKLGLRRANAVAAALVAQGARADSITASSVGKDDLAVQTEDRVKEPKNRRVVVTLVP
jgi:outer membrane protein OmpA-like peptidoglycan-associated protein